MKRVLVLIITACIMVMAWGQGFNPVNPPEPNALYKIKVKASIEGVAYVSGAGQYREGQSSYISTSSYNSNYKFRYWNKNGEKYTEEQWFYYTVEAQNVEFEAVYEFSPISPDDPTMNLKYRLYLKGEPEGCCSFNRTSGDKQKPEDWIWLNVYVNQGYDFLGWFDKSGVKVSSSTSFNYQMPTEDMTLTAKFKYNPTSPDSPNSQGGNIQDRDKGDLNGDSTVDVDDIVLLVQSYLNSENLEKIGIYDFNGDGIVDIEDAIRMNSYYLNIK